MPVLSNARHERFAQALFKGKPASEAYVMAGYKPDDGHASRLAGNGKVRRRVDELLERAAKIAETSAADIALQLDEDRDLAHALEMPSAAVSASIGKAKVLGLIRDRVEHTGKDGGPIETKDLSELELARRIAYALEMAARTKG